MAARKTRKHPTWWLLVVLILANVGVVAAHLLAQAHPPTAPAPQRAAVPSTTPESFPQTGWDKERQLAFDRKILSNEAACGWKGVQWRKDAAAAREEAQRRHLPMLGIAHMVTDDNDEHEIVL